MRYVDSTVFVSPALYADAGAARARKVLSSIAAGELEACTSVLTWDEVTWAMRKLAGSEAAREEGAKFLKFPGLRILAVDLETVSLAQKLVEKYGLGPRDAVHAACAIENGVREMVSEDAHFDKVKELARIRP